MKTQIKTTHIQAKRVAFASSQVFILKTGLISENDYNNLWLDTGKKFLKNILREHPKMLKEIQYENLFWRWWIVQWKNEENELLHAIITQEIEF